jgi:hypothetical protein
MSDLPEMAPSAKERVDRALKRYATEAGGYKLRESARHPYYAAEIQTAFRDGVLAERAAGGDAMRLIQEAAKLLPGHDDAMRKDERERILALLREPSEEFVNHLAGTSPDWWGPTAAEKRRKVRADLLAIATEIGGEE